VVGDFTLTAVNGAPPPALVAATISCDQYISSGSLSLTASFHFSLDGLMQLDCTRAGGQVEIQTLSLVGSYTRNGPNLIFTLPGQGSVPATFDGTRLTTTIPASGFTFPTAVTLEFTVATP
jgi:hypothetical protein